MPRHRLSQRNKTLRLIFLGLVCLSFNYWVISSQLPDNSILANVGGAIGLSLIQVGTIGVINTLTDWY